MGQKFTFFRIWVIFLRFLAPRLYFVSIHHKFNSVSELCQGKGPKTYILQDLLIQYVSFELVLAIHNRRLKFLKKFELVRD